MRKNYSSAKYRVILLSECDGKINYKKTLHRCNTIETIWLNYHKIKDSNNVLYSKKTINSNGIKKIKYKIAIVKVKEESDIEREIRNDYGKLIKESFLGDWVIIETNEFDIEETFWMYGMSNKRSNRPNISEIIKRLVTGAYAKNCVKQIIIVHNKVIIWSESQFDMVVCKNRDEAKRLHHTLAKIAKKQKLKKLLFMGTASKAMVSRMYDIILDNTNWTIERIRRTSSRP